MTRTGTRTGTGTHTGTGTWTTGVTAIALCTSCSRANKHIIVLLSLIMGHGAMQMMLHLQSSESFVCHYMQNPAVVQVYG